MYAFESLIDNLPAALAFQDALSNSVSGNAPAAATPGATGTPPAGGGQPAPNPFSFMGPLLLVMVFVIGFSMLTSRREKKRREQMLSSVKKGEKVLTIGGIIGVVADVRDDEVILRVDEHSNTKMRFTRSSIQQVLQSVSNGESAGASGGAKAGGKADAAASEVEVKAGQRAGARV